MKVGCLFWRRLTYSSIVDNPDAYLAAAAELYLHVLSVVLRMSCPVSRLATWVWNPPRALTILGVNTQVSDPKVSTYWITVLKKEVGHPSHRYLLAEDARHPTPNLLFPGQVPHHRRPVFVRRQDHPPQVF